MHCNKKKQFIPRCRTNLLGTRKYIFNSLSYLRKHIQHLKNKSSIGVKSIDHDFVVGPQHKLIPSVYGICEVNKNGNVSYSGDTFMSIRSGKHDTSNAFTFSSWLIV